MSKLRDAIQSEVVVQRLYYYLWKHIDYEFQKVGKAKIQIPDTVIFMYRQPIFYFYTDEDGFIKKKAQITKESILKRFINYKPSLSGVIGYFISQQDGMKMNDIHKQQPEIRYLSKNDFSTLFSDESGFFSNGILQKFVDPIGNENTCLQAI